MDIEQLEKDMAKIQKSTKTTFRHFSRWHHHLMMKYHWYYKWHLNPHHRQVHFGLLSAYTLGIIIGVAYSCLAPINFGKANETSPITISGKASVTSTNGDLDFNSSPYHSNVTIDNISKNFSGFAWSVDLGWVDFGSEDNTDVSVHVDKTSGIVTGQAKVVSTGKYIYFNTSPYNSDVAINANGDFSGFAWSEDLGWINFSGVKVPGLSFTSPHSPQNLRVYDVSDRNLSDYALLVRWQAPADFDSTNFSSYVVERSTDGVNFIQQSSTTSRAYYDTNVSTDKTYYYRIKTQNKTGTVETSEIVSKVPTGKYTTPPKLVSEPTVTIAPTSITVKWATDRDCSSFVEIKDGNTFVSEQGQTEETTDHVVKVVGLRSQRDYIYMVHSTDIDGNTLTGSEQKFTTANTPSVYDLNVTNITQGSAIVNFKSTAVANFILYYGETANYGMNVDESSSSSTTNHSLSLSGLKPGTSYFYRVSGTDSDGNELRSENSFSTLPMPEISKFEIQPEKDAPSTTLDVEWQTNVPTTSIVKYSTDGTNFKEQSASDLVTDHKITISDLLDKRSYTIYASGRDQFGNIAESQKTSFDTPIDTRPPKISEVIIESSNVGNSSDKAQIAISWKTDEPANSQVEYDQGLSGNEYTRKTSLDGTYTNHHLVIISDLDPGKPYHLRILSSDPAGNLTKSGDSTVITGEVSKSALQIILNTMQNIFGWMGKLIR